MNKYLTTILASLIFGLVLSCGELFLGTDPANNPEENFQILWDDFDKHYSRFELKKVNWDSLYNIYKPKINSSTTGEELFEITSSLLSHLKDSHARIESPHGIYSYRKKDYHHYFNLEIIYYNYLINPRNFRYFTYGMLNENLGYIHISTFNENEDSYKFIDNIIRELGSPDGLIIDVRDNGGGNSSNAEIVASRFCDKERLYAYAKYRNGPNHNDFTELFPSYILPDGDKQYIKPIVVLTNRYSGSATEDFILMMQVFPYLKFIGDTTAGAIGGHPITRELPNGWLYRMSTGLYYSPDNINYEGVGTPPNIAVVISETDSLNGKDTILEAAIELYK